MLSMFHVAFTHIFELKQEGPGVTHVVIYYTWDLQVIAMKVYHTGVLYNELWHDYHIPQHKYSEVMSDCNNYGKLIKIK